MPSTSASPASTGIIRTVAKTRGHDEPPHGRDGHRAQRVHLLGHGHGAELRRDARADAPSHHERGQDGPELADEGEGNDPADEELSAEGGQRIRGLQGQDHAREEGGDPGDRDGLDPDLVHLPQEFGAVEGPGDAGDDRLAGELGQAAQVLDRALPPAAEPVDEAQPPEVPVEDRGRGLLGGAPSSRAL